MSVIQDLDLKVFLGSVKYFCEFCYFWLQEMDFSVHRNREGMSNWADDSPKSATDYMVRSLSGKVKAAWSISTVIQALPSEDLASSVVRDSFSQLPLLEILPTRLHLTS